MLPGEGNGSRILETIHGCGLDPNFMVGDLSLASIFWALLGKGLNVYIYNGQGYCEFSKLSRACTSSDSQHCDCTFEGLSRAIVIEDVRSFLDKLLILHNKLEAIKYHRWGQRNSILCVFNNATEYDLRNPLKYLDKVLGILENLDTVKTFQEDRLGSLELQRTNPVLFLSIQEAGPEQESPFEFIINLDQTDTHNPSVENELHRVRFGLISSDTAVVTSVQSSQLKYTRKDLSDSMRRFFVATARLFEKNDRSRANLPEGYSDLLQEYQVLNDRLLSGEINYCDITVVNFIRNVREFIIEYNQKKLNSLRLNRNPHNSLESIAPSILTEIDEFDEASQVLASYMKRDANSRVLNPEMRTGKDSGRLSSVHIPCFSLSAFIFWARVQGIKKILFPLSFPLRDMNRLPSTTEYILNTKRLLVDRIEIELGLKPNPIDDETCYEFDISRLEVSEMRAVLKSLHRIFIGEES